MLAVKKCLIVEVLFIINDQLFIQSSLKLKKIILGKTIFKANK
jgi:hypothetical protein